jgi:chromosome segregation ATPase
MKGVRTTRKLHRKKPKRHGGTDGPDFRTSRKGSMVRRKVAWGPIEETREFTRSPTEQDIDDADLQNKIKYYSDKINTLQKSNVSLQIRLNGMQKELVSLQQTHDTLFNKWDQNKSAQYLRHAHIKSRGKISYFEKEIIKIHSQIEANNSKITIYQHYVTHPTSISRLLQTHRRHESRQIPRTTARMTPLERTQRVSSANQELQDRRHYKTG